MKKISANTSRLTKVGCTRKSRRQMIGKSNFSLIEMGADIDGKILAASRQIPAS
jgi:hypothetical protein